MSDIRFYEKTCYEERLKDDATQRLADALAGWAANGSQPPKPTFLHFLHEVSKERWAQESEVFRAEIRTANEADYEDYTRAKTAFFDEIQPRLRQWSAERRRPPTS